MKIYNLSTRLKTAQLWPLVNFVTRNCESSFMAHLVVEDSSESLMDGFAWKYEGNDPTAPSRVLIQIGSLIYPKVTVYRKSVGPIKVRCWEDEFVHVLGHEMRHVDQYWSAQPGPRQYEVDAEKFGLRMLRAWNGEAAAPMRRAA